MANSKPTKSTDPFGATVRRLLEENGGGSVSALVNRAREQTEHPKSKDAVSQMMRGATSPSAEVMEMVALGFGIEPEVFAEYRMWKVRKALNPAEPATKKRGGVGFETALRNLTALERTGARVDLPIPAGAVAGRQNKKGADPR